MSDPLVTVLMPVYNGEQHLAEAIDSVLTQDAPDFELLVVDDGSTDGTPEILRSCTDPRLRVVRVGHLGLIGALNRGLEQARGRFISRMDADDIMSGGRLRRQMEAFARHPRMVACGTQYELFGAREGLVRPQQSPRSCYTHLVFGSCVPHATVMIRADVIREHRVRYREGYLQAEDFKLFSELAEFGELRNLGFVGLRYRQHLEQVTRRESEVMIRTHLRICVENLAARGVRFDEERMRALLWPEGQGVNGVLVYLVRRMPVVLFLGARTGGLAGLGQGLAIVRERIRALLRR